MQQRGRACWEAWGEKPCGCGEVRSDGEEALSSCKWEGEAGDSRGVPGGAKMLTQDNGGHIWRNLDNPIG